MLSIDAFEPFGDVLTLGGAEQRIINEGSATRFHDLAKIDIASDYGYPLLNVFRGQAKDIPVRIKMMERHPLGSQAFWPLSNEPFLVVVAKPGAAPAPDALRAFYAPPGIGVNYEKGVWHHPLLALNKASDFIVIDRGGDGQNLDEISFTEDIEILLHGFDDAS
ncbi:MAG: ureidoglycolate lyase [Rhizobiales bacterium]|nr:ureidoglycolate lyase [Hyphomicrobiales bacterium]